MTTKKPSSEPSMITLAEASTLIERPQNTIRDWIKKELITAKTDEKGRWLVEHDSLIQRAITVSSKATSKLNTRNIKSNPYPTYESINEASTQTLIRNLETSLERERRINDELREQIKKLESEIFKLTHEMQAILTKDSPLNTVSRWIRSKTA